MAYNSFEGEVQYISKKAEETLLYSYLMDVNYCNALNLLIPMFQKILSLISENIHMHTILQQFILLQIYS